MALVSIDGVDLPTPSDFSVGIMDLSKAERNANGTMIIERIATKRKLEIAYSYLTGSSLSAILTAVDPVFFNVTYLDPKTNGFRTGSFYCGDRNVGMLDYVGNIPRYRDCKFDLIER
jgi:hypothetical protein